ncbi:PepSY-associated TM helix domain-containing protein [Streptomyces apocyni]|uniref:PepSY-associated TM helix domain-containing protein n=1 Tax=Streptomyces apocyni TaxID=2654677 RepID=UPI0012EAC5C9|nr:PepSY domain-containing protein [Streptomyces apocyni]
MTLDARPEPDTSEQPDTPDQPDQTKQSARQSTWAALRPLLLRLHFYAGVLIAPFLFIAATTGLLYALSFQAEKAVYRYELSAPVGDTTLPLSEQVAAARETQPDDATVTAVWPSSEDGATTRVLFDSPKVADDASLAVFVDPYTAEVRGELASYGSSGALPLRAWLSQLHADLHLGELGRNYSELAASWLWVVALGGVALWFGRRRARRRDLVIPTTGQRKGRTKTLSWHGTVGLWAALGLVLLSATGLTWSRYAGESIGALRSQLGGQTPSVDATLAGGAAPASGGGHEGHGGDHGATGHQGPDIGLDRVLEIARAEGIDGQLTISLPSEDSGYVVRQTDKQVPLHLDSVAIDPADGTVVDTLRFADYPMLAQLTSIGIAAHMGVLFGLANQLALAALMVGTLLLIVWGYRMWWLRRPTRDRALSVGRPMPRGAWRKVPLPGLLPLAAVAALVGWFVPMLGISLLAFLVIDAAAGLVTRARAGA